MKKVLITGANGLIGRHLVKKLLEEGKEVFAAVTPGGAYEDPCCERLHISSFDLNEAPLHVEEFPAGEIDVMYALAWAGVRPEDRDRFDIQMKNISLTMRCMEFAAALGIKRVVFPGSVSSYLYYGKPLDRNAVPSPADAYGAVKVALKYMCDVFAEKNGIDFINTIIAGVYSADRRDNNVIFYTVNKLLRGERPVYTKLEQYWDYIHIDDLSEALFLVGEKGKRNAVYTIGHGDNWKLRNYIEIIHNAIDSSLSLGVGEIPYEGGRMPSVRVDQTELQRDTGFVPRVTFEEGIAEVIEKVKSDLERF